MDLLILILLILAVIFIVIIHITNIKLRSEIPQLDHDSRTAYNLGLWISILEAVALALLSINIVFHITEFRTSLTYWIPITSAVVVFISLILSSIGLVKYKNSIAYEENPDPYNKFIQEIIFGTLTIITITTLLLLGYIRKPKINDISDRSILEWSN